MICTGCGQHSPPPRSSAGEARPAGRPGGGGRPPGPPGRGGWGARRPPPPRRGPPPPLPRPRPLPPPASRRRHPPAAGCARGAPRKQVTVLFADLKGSMELLADRDPEEARNILDPVLERMMEAVHRYEGTVNQVMGDGIMALFGAPLAHEDHAGARLLRRARHAGRGAPLRRGAAPQPRHRGPDPRRAQLGRGRGALDRQRPAHGLHGGRADDPPGGAHGAAGRARARPPDRRTRCGSPKATSR